MLCLLTTVLFIIVHNSYNDNSPNKIMLPGTLVTGNNDGEKKQRHGTEYFACCTAPVPPHLTTRVTTRDLTSSSTSTDQFHIAQLTRAANSVSSGHVYNVVHARNTYPQQNEYLQCHPKILLSDICSRATGAPLCDKSQVPDPLSFRCSAHWAYRLELRCEI